MFDPQDSQEGPDKMKDVVFCSNNCFVLYSAAVQAKNSENKVSIKRWWILASRDYCSYVLKTWNGAEGSDTETLNHQCEITFIFAEPSV